MDEGVVEGRSAAIAWPPEGSFVAFLWDPDTCVLHWMKRRRSMHGTCAKPNLLAQFMPLQYGHRYQFFMIQVPDGLPAPGVGQGLLERVAVGRGPTRVRRSPWHANVYQRHLPDGYVITDAVEFACGTWAAFADGLPDDDVHFDDDDDDESIDASDNGSKGNGSDDENGGNGSDNETIAESDHESINESVDESGESNQTQTDMDDTEHAYDGISDSSSDDSGIL